MRKIRFVAVAAMVAALAVSCKSQEEKETAFKAEVKAIIDGYNTVAGEIYADSTLTDEQKNEKIAPLYEEANKKYIDLNKVAFDKNKNNRIAVMALQNIFPEITNQEVIDYAAQLADSLQMNENVVKMVEAAQKGLLTEEGKMFTDFTIEDSDGKTVSFSDFVGKGQYVLVDFWASWCGPCKMEIPNIRKAYETYGPKGLVVLSVAVWDRPEDTKAAAAEHGVVWNQIINAQHTPTELYGISGIPQIMLFGPDGTILKRDLRGEGIEDELSKYFQE